MVVEKILNVFKEGNEYSLTRLLAMGNYVFFVVITIYLVLSGKSWGNYEVFATITGGGGILTQIVNKAINGKYNTCLGESGKPLSGGVNNVR